MSYQDQANLAQDSAFAERLSAALVKEAVGKTDDFLADDILRSPEAGTRMFMPFIAGAPGFDVTYASGGQASIGDLDILSAVQASWTRVQELYHPTPLVVP